MPKFNFVPDEVILELENRIRSYSRDKSGLSYCIVVQNEAGEYEYHDRPHQPCIGGEFRKYKSTHGDECTRPTDKRPGDLKHPFPKGKPVAVGYWFPYFGEENQKEVELLFSDSSPWIKGFGSSDSIHFVKTIRGDLAYANHHHIYPGVKKLIMSGFILKHGDIDPTVWINLLKRLQKVFSNKNFVEYEKAGYSDIELLIASTFLNGIVFNSYDKKFYVQSSSAYSFAPNSSIKRFITQNPRDLTGGTWENRFDYNRFDMANIFQNDKEEETIIPLYKKIDAVLKVSLIDNPSRNHLDVAREVIQQEIASCQ